MACRQAVAAARYRSALCTTLAARSSAACKAAAWPTSTGPWAPVAGAWSTLSEEAGLAWQQADTRMWLPHAVCPARSKSQAASCLGSGWSHAATLPGVSEHCSITDDIGQAPTRWLLTTTGGTPLEGAAVTSARVSCWHRAGVGQFDHGVWQIIAQPRRLSMSRCQARAYMQPGLIGSRAGLG